MAEKILNTRILMKVDTLENWNSSTLPLKKGELAFATIAASAGTGLTEPVVMVKIGTEEAKTFSDLPWAFHAKAADVLAACKDEASLKTFINGVIADAGIATNEAMEALAGRVTTAEGEIDTLQSEMDAVEAKAAANETAIATLNGLVGDTKVADQITTAINNLNLADTYAAKVHGHEIADVNGLSDSIAAAKKAGTDANAALEAYKTLNDAAVKVNSDAIAGIKNGTTIDNFAEVEEALAGKQAAGDYSLNGHKHEIADVNGLADAIADAKKAGTDAATAAGQALTDAKDYTDSELERLVGDETVGTQISTAIEELDLANTYDAKGAAAAAESAAKSHADGLNTAMDGRMQAVEAKKHEHSNKTVLDGITAEKVAAWDAAEQNAKDYADGLDEVMDGRVAALEAKFGDGEGNVEAQIAAAVAAEAKLREDADADLQEQIEANDAEILALQGLVGDKKVSEAIAAAVKVEEDRAKGIEGGLESRLAAVEADYLTSTEEKALQDQITANANAIELLTNGVSADEVDGVNDLIQYVKDHGTEVTGIKGDIKTNADDIDALEGRMTTAEGAIATKAAQADLEALDDRVEAVETELNTETTGLKARMTAAEADIDALETKVGDKTVAEQISAVTNPLAERVVALEAVDHEHANKTVLDGIEAADVAAWDAKVDGVTAAADSGLKATRTGNAIAIEIDDSMTFIFDCGTSAV